MNALLIHVRFTAGVYRGGELAQPEPLPSPARLHAAFLSAAGGGPTADTVDGELVPRADAAAAVRWLEEHPPIGVHAPRTRLTAYSARRHRVRAAVDLQHGMHHREQTAFEPFSALDGAVVFAWPPAPTEVHAVLVELAREITHLGRADSTVVVSVAAGSLEHADRLLVPTPGRGAGHQLQVARPGRTAALLDAHGRARARGPHSAGRKSKQAPDEPVQSADQQATSLVRFAAPHPATAWPFAEVWRVPASLDWPGWAIRPGERVTTAVSVHRALVCAIGDDVPSFVTGRDGAGPLSGDGHLAIQFAGSPAELVLALPVGVCDADRAQLLDALASRPRVRVRRQQIALDLPQISPAITFWRAGAERFATEVPLVLDAPGTPRHRRWTLEDSVLCSLGYALRGPLERAGVNWGTGWTFRCELVAMLRRRGAAAHAFRVLASASRFLHRSRPGDLVIAAHAVLELGELAGEGRGFLALGRARHLGGGLLQPLSAGAR